MNLRTALYGAIIAALLSAASSARGAAAWYNASWTNRIAITIDNANVAGTLTNFPVLINITNASLQAAALSSGNDLLFTSVDGTTKLDHEIESYINSNGALVAWVKVPILSSTVDTILYLYYGNSASTNQQNTAAVWDSNFKAVWHLKENPAGTAPQMRDSTATARHGTNINMVSGNQQAALIGGGLFFDGVNEYVQTTSSESKTANEITWECWFKATTTTFGHHLMWQGTNTGNGWGDTGFQQEMHISIGNFLSGGSQANQLSFFLGDAENGADAGVLAVNTSFSDTNGWHHVAAVVTSLSTSPSVTFYLDGVSVGSDTGTTARTLRSKWNTNVRLGVSGVLTRYYAGRQDEARISTAARSAAWIATEYDNQSSPAAFYSVGSPESQLATKLAITLVNGGSSPTVGAAFNVVVQAQDAGGTSRNVVSNTVVTLSLNTGSGTLGGTLTGNVTAGTNSVTISGVTYSKAENGVILTATRTSGDSLTAGNSSNFNVSTAMLTVSSGLTADNKVYDDTTTATISSNTVVLAGVLAGDTGNVSLSTNGYTATFANATVGSGIVVTVSGLMLTGSAAANYTLTQPSLTANITGAAWYNASWTNRLTIVIDRTKVSGPLTNFPVLINLTNTSLQASALASGDDLLFTSVDGTTKLAHEIESYTNSNGALVAWVNVPLLSSTVDTTLYLYYGNSASANQQNVAGVWDANFKGVWHLKENPAGTAPQMMDSTSNSNHGTSQGAQVSGDQLPGRINGALRFDGANDWVNCGNTSGLQITGALTLEAWVKPAVTSVYMGIAGKLVNLPNNAGFAISKVDTGRFRSQAANGTSTIIDSASAYAETNWHHIVGVHSAGNVMTMYVDGVAQAATASSAISDSANAFHIGRQYVDYAGRFWDGIIDEVRVSTAVRSAFWIGTEYNNQNSPATFYSLGSQENPPPTKLAITTINGGSNPTAGTAFSVIVHSQDAGGTPRNVLFDTAVTLSLNTGSGILGGTLTGTITTGNNSVTISGVTYTKAESGVILTATRTSGDTLTAGNSSSFTVNPGALHHLAFAAFGTQTAGSAFNVTITAQDINNNTVTGFTGTANLSTSAGTISPTVSGAFSAGTRTESVTVSQAGSGKTITATRAGGSETGTSASFIVNPGAIDHYAVSASSPQTAGANFTATVTAQDINNNTVTTDSATVVTLTGTGSVQFDSNGDAAFGDNTKPLSSGAFTINTKDNVAESMTLTATSAGGKTGTSTSIVVYATGTWLGAISTDWFTAGNWWGGVPTSSTDAFIPPIGGSVLYEPAINASGAVCRNITINASASLTISDSYILSVSGNWANSGSFTAGTGTVIFNGGSAQTIGGAATTTFNNLTINNTGGVTASRDTTVNGVLNLQSANPSATKGTLDMWDGAAMQTLTMGGSATTTGSGDVTGIVKRTTFVAATEYDFGNHYTTVNFQNTGTLPTSVSIKITIGAAPAWKTNGVQRTYALIQSGASGCFATINTHYLDTELNGNTKTTLVYWRCVTPFTPGSATEIGRANYDITGGWVGISSVPMASVPSSFGVAESTFGDSQLPNSTWNGSVSADWTTPTNWTPNAIPSDLTDVVIPDASSTPNSPTLPVAAVSIRRLTLQSGAILNATATSTLTIAGASGAWSDNGGTFNPSTSTVIFINALATISGTTEFYNVTIDSGAALTIGGGTTMAIGGTMINNGTWGAAQNVTSTVEYNGGAQTVLSPNGLTPGYNSLILSGSGTKTLASTTTASGNVEIASGVVFNLSNGGSSAVGSLTIGGVLQAAGTWGATGSGAGHIDDTHFSGTGILNVSNGALDHFAISTITSPQTAGTPITSVTLTAQDANSHTVTSFGSTVTYTGTAGITGTSAAFTAGQLTGVSVTPITAGSGRTFTVAGGSPSQTGTATFDVNPGAISQLVMNPATISTATAGTSVSGSFVSITAKDANGNVCSSGPNAFTGAVTFGGTAGASGTSGNFSAGVLTTFPTLTPTVAGGGLTITATSGAMVGTTTITTVNPGAIASYVVSATTPETAGATFSTTVTAKDANGNTVTTDSATVVTMTSSGSAQFDGDANGTFGDNTKTLSSGAFSISTKDTVAESITLTATDGNSKTGTSPSITVNAGALDHFTFAAIPTQTVGASFSVTITAQDANNNTVTNFTATVDLTTTAGTISPTVSEAFSAGGLTQSVAVTQAGSGKTITATKTSGAESGTSATFTVTQGNSANAVGSSANPSPTGSNVTFTATLTAVAPSGGTPTGTVQFRTNGVALGAPVTLGSGVAGVSTALLPHGSNTVAAEYAGDANFVGSTNSLVQVVNTPPLAPVVTLERAASVSYRLRIVNLLTNCSDADADTFVLAGIGNSTNGAVITTNATFIFYTPPAANGNVTDSCTYTLGDGFGGTATGTLVLTITAASTNQTHNIISLTLTTNNAVILEIAGIPNRTYLIQATTNVAAPTWETIGTNVAGTNGLFTFFDPDAVNWPSRWYRTATQ